MSGVRPAPSAPGGARIPVAARRLISRRWAACAGSAEMFEFSASELGMEAAADGSWGFGEGDFTVTGWLSPGETFATGVEDPDKDWANFFAKADPGPGRLQYGAFASLYSDHRIRFGVEDFPDSRLEVTCGDSCVPRAECADDPGDTGDDPCAAVLGVAFSSCSCLVKHRWEMLTFVREDHVLRIYSNARLVGEKAVPVTDVSNLGPLMIAAHPVFHEGMNIDGFLDDLRVYDFALNATQVVELMGDTWALNCYDVTAPENGLPGACAVPSEFNPGGLFHPDGYLQTGTWCNYACLFGYELVGRRPYCNYGFDLGNATCEPVVVGDNCTDVRAENFRLRRPKCTRGPAPTLTAWVLCDGACVPRESCDAESNSTCDVLSAWESHEARPEGTAGVAESCTGAGFRPGPCVDYGLDACSSVGMIRCGEACVAQGTVLDCAALFERSGSCPAGCLYTAEVVAIPPAELWTEQTCEYSRRSSETTGLAGAVAGESGNTWRAAECVDPAGDDVNVTDAEWPDRPHRCTYDASGYEWAPSPILRDDGSCNYTCAMYANFGAEADLDQCMIYDHNPWVWNEASSGLLEVRSGKTFLLQGPSDQAEYEGRVTVDDATLVARHVVLQSQEAPAGGALAVVGGHTTVENSIFAGNRALYDGTPDSGFGGAIWVTDGAELVVRETRFSGNRASIAGGAVFVDVQCSATIIASTMTENGAGGEGGALWGSNCSIAISSSTFDQNNVGRTNGTHDRDMDGHRRRLGSSDSFAGPGVGGAVFLHGADFTASHTAFVDNLATIAGGAMYTTQGKTQLETTVLQENQVKPDCSFIPGDNSTCGFGCTYTAFVQGVTAVSYRPALPRRCVDNDPNNPAGPYIGPTVPRQSCANWDFAVCRYKVGCSDLPASVERQEVEGVIGVPESCDDRSHETGGTAGGGIYAERVLLTVDFGAFVDNNASAGPELYLLDMPDGWLLKDTPIGSDAHPFDRFASVTAIHVPPNACSRHACPLGHKCTYANYSTFCPRCYHTLFSDDGMSCKRSEVGDGSSANGSVVETYPLTAPHQAASVPCDPTLTSAEGFCLPCPRGAETNSSGLCNDCLPGLFSNDGAPCRPCPLAAEPNDGGEGGATDCLPCMNGTYSADGLACIICPGAFTVNATKTGCDPIPSCLDSAVEGSYSPDDGKTCLPCPDGTEVMTNQSGCDPCVGNEVSPLGISCRACPPGTQPNDATAAWRSDLAWIDEGSDTITPGPSWDAIRSWRLTKQTVSRTDCVSCEEVSPAAYSPDGVVCLDCPIGKEPNRNRTACQNCSDLELWLDGECRRCPSGSQPNPNPGFGFRAVCADCPPGFAGLDGDCVLCEAGKEPTVDRTECTFCSPGTVSDQATLASVGFCPVCPPGRASEENGARDVYQSLLTPRHNFSSHQNRTECLRCEYGQYSSDGVRCRFCSPGYEVNAAQDNCTACPLGKYSPDGSDCVLCEPGEEMNAPLAATGCLSCALRGVAYHSTDAVWCTECIPGTTPNEDQSDCRPCPSRTAGPPGECSVCEDGTRPTTDRTSCRRCPIAHAGYSGECVRCPDGFEPNADRTGCLPCPQGFAGRNGRCSQCGVGTIPNSWLNCSDPSHDDGDSCLAGGGSCSDPSFTSRSDCLAHGTCCIATVEEGVIQVTSCAPLSGLEADCTLPPMVASRGSWSRAATAWTPLRWTSTNLWTPERAECSPCAPYEYGPDGASCAQCGAGYQMGSDRSVCEACPVGKYSSAPNGTIRIPSANLTSRTIEAASDSPVQIFHDPPVVNQTEVGVSFRLAASSYPPVRMDLTLQDAAGRNLTLPFPAEFGSLTSGEVGPFPISTILPGADRIVSLRLRINQTADVDDACPPWDRHCGHVFLASLHQSPLFPESVDLAGELTWNDGATREGIHHLRGVACGPCKPGSQPNRAGRAKECLSCAQWGPGYYSPDGLACVTCASGKQPTSDRSACEPCPITDKGLHGLCEHCPSGYEPTASQTACQSCPPGHVGYDGTCWRCANGTAPNPTQLECLSCEPGYAGTLGFCSPCSQRPFATVPTTDRTACRRCIDTYSDDGFTCKRCPWGWGVNGQENGCDICPFNLVSPDGVACVPCDPGFEVNAPIDPEYDSLIETEGLTECRSCELRGRGYFSSDGVECEICPAGSTPDLTLDCVSPGVNDWGSVYQGQDCPAGRPAVENWVPRSKCERCRDGTTNAGTPDELADKVCDVCPDGQWSWASVTCEYCPANQAGLNGMCRDCPDGTMPNVEHQYCDVCPTGRAGRSGWCHQCLPGYVPNPERVRCELCAVLKGPDRCQCGEGTSAEDCSDITDPEECEATGQCQNCVSEGVTASTCARSTPRQCSIRLGKWSAKWTETDLGEIAPSEWYAANGTCHRCTSGKQPDANGTACEPCPAGEAGVDGACRPCRAGVEVPNVNRTDCVYSIIHACSVMARAYADKQTLWLVDEMHAVNVAAKAWRVVPLVLVIGLGACVWYIIYRIQAYLAWNRIFAQVNPLAGEYEFPPTPTWLRFLRWLWAILLLIARGDWREILHRLRVCCCPARRARPKPPPVFDEVEVMTIEREEEESSEDEAAGFFEEETVEVPTMEDEEEAAEYTASFM